MVVVVLIKAQEVYFADEGDFQTDMCIETWLEMKPDLAHDSKTLAPAKLVSMFQTNSIAFPEERELNWFKHRPDAV